MSLSKPVKIDANGTALLGMAAGRKAAIQPVAFRLRTMCDDGSGLDELAAMISQSDDAVLVALMNATASSHGPGQASERLAAAFAMISALQGWAQPAGKQFEVGSIAAERARQAKMKKQSFIFGTFVFAAYTNLTGNRVAISRGKQGTSEEGKVIGPLLRFTLAFYGRMRARCADTPDLAQIAKQRALKPSADTVEAWVRKFKLPETYEGLG